MRVGKLWIHWGDLIGGLMLVNRCFWYNYSSWILGFYLLVIRNLWLFWITQMNLACPTTTLWLCVRPYLPYNISVYQIYIYIYMNDMYVYIYTLWECVTVYYWTYIISIFFSHNHVSLEARKSHTWILVVIVFEPMVTVLLESQSSTIRRFVKTIASQIWGNQHYWLMVSPPL